MLVEKKNVRKDNTSCNFCNRGKLNEGGYGLIYPYEYVYTFKREGNGIQADICPDCLKELHVKTIPEITTWNNLPGKCIYQGKEWNILSIDMQGGYFDLHNWEDGMREQVDVELCKPIL